jgi:hypothetical protein
MHRSLAVGSFTLLSISFSGSVRAAETPARFHLGLQTGFALPMGKLMDADAERGMQQVELGDVLSGQVPLAVDFAYRLAPAVALGLYAQYGVVLVKEHDRGCPSGWDCSAGDIRFGIFGRYDFAPAAKLRPWVGLGAGYEILIGWGELGGFSSTHTYTGFELFNLRAGADFQLSDRFGLGPCLSFSLGNYDTEHIDGPIGEGSNDVSGLHQWLMLGVNGSFGL